MVVVLQATSYFSTLFSLRTSYCTLPFSYTVFCFPSLFYLHCKFYFLLFFALFLFPTLIISPPPALSKSFSFVLVTSYSFRLSRNILTILPPLLILAHLLLISRQWLGVFLLMLGYFCWVVLFW